MKNVPHINLHRTDRFEIRRVGSFELICTAEEPKTARKAAEQETGYIIVKDNDGKYSTAMIILDGTIQTISKEFADATK